MKIAAELNPTLLGWVAEQAPSPMRRMRARRRIPPDDLRCHPDLCARLRSAAAGLPGVRLRYLIGLPLLIHPNGVVFGVAAGTSWTALRLPVAGRGAIVRTEQGSHGLAGDWVDVDPWLTDMPVAEGTGRLRGWARAAYGHATELGPPMAVRPGPRSR